MKIEPTIEYRITLTHDELLALRADVFLQSDGPTGEASPILAIIDAALDVAARVGLAGIDAVPEPEHDDGEGVLEQTDTPPYVRRKLVPPLAGHPAETSTACLHAECGKATSPGFMFCPTHATREAPADA